MAKSRRLYLIRAIYEWAADNGYTPHLLIAADAPGVTVPREFVKEGRITLNVSAMAVQNLDLRQDPITFFARFGGRQQEVQVPSGAVLAAFARENGEGIVFGEVEPTDPTDNTRHAGPRSAARGKPKLKLVK